jgi:hypothetical protein
MTTVAVKVLPVATGNDKPFIDEGQGSIAYTPRGRFIVYDKEVGWHTGSLDQFITPISSAGA